MKETEINMHRLGMVLNQPVFRAHELFIGKDKIYFMRVNMERIMANKGEGVQYDVSLAFNRTEPN